MRRALIIFAILILCGLGVVCYAGASLTAAQDDVSFTEIASYGDISAADGLTVGAKAHFARHLLWDTTHTFGENGKTKTDFSFSTSEQYFMPEYTGEGLSVNITSLDQGASSSGGNLLGEPEGSYTRSWDSFQIIDVLRDIASRTPDGGEHTETINFRDYYEYYPLNVSIRHDHAKYYYAGNNGGTPYISQQAPTEELFAAFSDYFKIPVPEEHPITVWITKDSSGSVVGYSTSQGYPVYLYSVSAETEEGIYFALSTEGVIDFSGIRGGVGIYLLPAATITDDGKQLPTLDYNNLQTVYSLDESVSTLRLNLSEDGTCLNLITLEDDTIYLTVIDRATMTQKQKALLFESAGEAGLMTAQYSDGLLYAQSGDSRFMLLERGWDNTYRPVLTGTRENELPEEIDHRWWYEQVLAWDGARLAFVSKLVIVVPRGEGYMGYYSEESCGFAVEVYGEAGLLYQGAYSSSLDVLTLEDSYISVCRLIDYSPLSVRWR